MKTFPLTRNESSATAGKTGFTLIELLTVIAIIGILAAILIPVVSRVRESARQAACVSNLRQLGVAMQMYIDDEDRLPGPYFSSGAIHSFSIPSNSRVAVQFAPYLDVPDPAPGEKRVVELLVCPSYEGKASTAIESGISYRVNSGGTHQAFLYGTDSRVKRLTDIEYPSRTYALADDFNGVGAGWATAPLHGSSRNVLFMSGHVEKLSQSEYPDHNALQNFVADLY